MKIWTDFSSILSQITRLTDGRTDRRTDTILIARPRLHSIQRGKNASDNSEREVIILLDVIMSLFGDEAK